jgi:hypothetical protein
MPQEELDEITRSELGQYYDKLLISIGQSYTELQNFMLISETYPNLIIDYDNNFYQFNKDCAALGKRALDVLNEITLEYNVNNPMTPIALIDQTHYVKVDKKG